MIGKIFLTGCLISAAVVLAVVDTSWEVRKAIENAWRQS